MNQIVKKYMQVLYLNFVPIYDGYLKAVSTILVSSFAIRIN